MNTLYIDPFRLFDLNLSEDGSLNSGQLKRARRKVMAEFELMESSVIRYDDRDVDRSTVIQLLESLENPRHCLVLWEIHQARDWVEFLDGSSETVPEELKPLTPKHLPHLSSFIACRIRPLLKISWWEMDMDYFNLLCRMTPWIDPRDRDYAFGEVVRSINEEIEWLHQLIRRTNPPAPRFSLAQKVLKPLHFFFAPKGKARTFCNSRKIGLLNRLPDDLQEVRNLYASALLVLYDQYKNVGWDRLAQELIKAACSLDTDLPYKDEFGWGYPEGPKTNLEVAKKYLFIFLKLIERSWELVVSLWIIILILTLFLSAFLGLTYLIFARSLL